MDTEHRAIAELLALKDAPDDVLVDQVEAIGVTSVRYMLFDEADRLQTYRPETATECLALIDRIDALIRPGEPRGSISRLNSASDDGVTENHHGANHDGQQ